MRLYGGNPVQKFEIEVWEAEYIERSSFQLSTTWRFKSLLEFEQDLGKIKNIYICVKAEGISQLARHKNE